MLIKSIWHSGDHSSFFSNTCKGEAILATLAQNGGNNKLDLELIHLCHPGVFLLMMMAYAVHLAIFQQAMQMVLAGLECHDCFVYIGDILVVSQTFKQHLQHLEQVFDWLRMANLWLKPKKCRFLCNELSYLGHVITVNGVRPDLEKTENLDIFAWPVIS